MRLLFRLMNFERFSLSFLFFSSLIIAIAPLCVVFLENFTDFSNLKEREHWMHFLDFIIFFV